MKYHSSLRVAKDVGDTSSFPRVRPRCELRVPFYILKVAFVTLC